MHKVSEAIISPENNPIDGQVDIDDFVLGGGEKGKAVRSYDSRKKNTVCAVQL